MSARIECKLSLPDEMNENIEDLYDAIHATLRQNISYVGEFNTSGNTYRYMHTRLFGVCTQKCITNVFVLKYATFT